MRKIVFITALLLMTFVSAFAQRVSKEMPSGAKRVTGADYTQLQAMAKSASRAEATRLKPPGTTPPKFAIRTSGNDEVGITVEGRLTGRLRAGSTVIGSRTPPGGDTEYLQGWFFDFDVDPGGLWYSLENQKKATYNEQGGIARYEILVFGPDGFQIYSAEKSFNNYSNYNGSVRQIIEDGVAVYNGADSVPEFFLFGRFSGKVGVTIKDANSGVEWYVPDSLVTSNPFMVTVNIPQLEWFPNGTGDYLVTIADQTKFSDSFTLRVKAPPGDAHGIELEKRRLSDRIKGLGIKQ